MTLPNGPAGLTPNIEFGVGFGDLGGLVGRHQDAVAEILKAEVLASTAWNAATAAVWDGLQRGIPLALAIIQGLIHRLFNTAEQFPGMHEALQFVEQVPQLRELVNTLTGADGGLVELGDYVSTRWSEVAWLVQQLVALIQAAGKVTFGDVGAAIANAETNLQKLVSGAVGSGGSGFPWTFPVSFGTGSGFPWSFPVSFGDVEKSVADVGAAILNAPQTGQQVLNQLVQSISGVQTTVDHSLADLHVAVQQLPGSPPLAPVAVGVQQAATAAGQIGALVTNSLQADAAAAGTFLAAAGTNASGAVGQLNDAAVNAIGGAQAAVGKFGQALAGAFGSWFNALTGTPAPSVSAASLAAAMTSTSSAVTNNSANIGGMAGLSVASLNQALQKSAVGAGGGSSGTFVTLNFSSYVNQPTLSGIFIPSSAALSSSGANNPLGLSGASTSVTQYGVSSIGVGQSAVQWQTGTTAGYDFEYYPTPTTSDYQVVSAQMSANAPTLLIGRSNTTMGTFVTAFITWSGSGTIYNVYLGCFVGGAWTLLASTSINGLFNGLFELVLGNSNTSNPYAISVLWNGTILISYADSGHISQVGSSNRYAGLGGVDYVASPNQAPGMFTSWGVADNAPPAVIGSMFRAYRTIATANSSFTTPSPSTVAIATTTWNLLKFPASYFDTTQWLTGDMTYVSSTNTLTVSITASYTVEIAFAFVSAGSTFASPVLWHNGTLYESDTTPGYGTSQTPIVKGRFEIYCVAGDTLVPGFIYAGAGFSGTYGDPGGVGTYFSVALSNCGTLS